MPEGPGRLIAGQYRLVEQVGRGGFAVAGRRPPATLPGPRGRVTAVAFSRDGRILASAGGRDVLLWHAATGAPAGALTITEGTVDAVAFGPGGMLATGGDDATVRLWRLG